MLLESEKKQLFHSVARYSIIRITRYGEMVDALVLETSD